MADDEVEAALHLTQPDDGFVVDDLDAFAKAVVGGKGADAFGVYGADVDDRAQLRARLGEVQAEAAAVGKDVEGATAGPGAQALHRIKLGGKAADVVAAEVDIEAQLAFAITGHRRCAALQAMAARRGCRRRRARHRRSGR